MWRTSREAWEKEVLRKENIQQLNITLGQDSSDSDKDTTVVQTQSDEDSEVRPF